MPITMTITGGQTVISPGYGKLVMPLFNGTEHLPGALLLPGETNLLSLAQLEKAGYRLN